MVIDSFVSIRECTGHTSTEIVVQGTPSQLLPCATQRGHVFGTLIFGSRARYNFQAVFFSTGCNFADSRKCKISSAILTIERCIKNLPIF